MSVNTVALSTIVSFFVFGLMQIDVAHGVTFEQYLGLKYIMSIAVSRSVNTALSCGRMKVTRQNGSDEKYISSYSMYTNGILAHATDNGTFINSALYYKTHSEEMPEVIFIVEAITDNSELIVYPQMANLRSELSLLLSDKPTVSREAKLEFKYRAAQLDATTIDVDHSNCSY